MTENQTNEKKDNDERVRAGLEIQSRFKSNITNVLTKEEIKPGEFGQLPENYEEKLNETEYDNSDPHKVESSTNLIEGFNLFQKEIPGNYKNIYVPCCASNISPSISFPESRVIYVDIDQKAIDALLQNGNEAYCYNAITFEMSDNEKADIVAIFNPQIEGYQLIKNLNNNGYVLCNDYHRTATEFFEKKEEFELVGIIRNTNNGLILDKSNPQEYWEEVETDEAWKKFNFSWGGDIETYNEGKKFVEKVLDRPSNNVVKDYKMIRNNINEYMSIIKEKDIGINEGGETDYYKPKNLPKKKGDCDDIFVFKKI